MTVTVVPVFEFIAIKKEAYDSIRKLLVDFANAMQTGKGGGGKAGGGKAVADMPNEILAAFWPAPLQPFIRIQGTESETSFHINQLRIVRGKKQSLNL